MDNYIIGIVALLVVNFISRMISEKATKKLSQDKKAALVELFSKNRIFTFGIMIGVIVLFLVAKKFNIIEPWIAFFIYATILLCLIITSGYFSYRKLKDNNFPDAYIKSYLISTSLRFTGVLIFFAFIKF